MKKFFCWVLICFLLSNSAFSSNEKAFLNSEELKKELEFSEENEIIKKCRNCLFEQKFEYKISTDKYKKFFIAPNKKQMKYIVYYSNGSYIWLKFFRNPDFLYSNNDLLLYFVFDNYVKNYGIYRLFYNSKGILKYLTIQYNHNEHYCFDTDKNFLGILDNYKFYNKTGDIIFEKRDFTPFK